MPTSTTARYEPSLVELKWQGGWRQTDAFATPAPVEGRSDLYIFVAPLSMSEDIQLSHLRSYTLADSYARFRRSRGDGVLFAFGFEAIPLPAELSGTAKAETHADQTTRAYTQMRDMLERMGYSFDWSRTFSTCEPDMYRWSQWLFLTLLEDGLVYRRNGLVNCCESCHAILAPTQVNEARCSLCRGDVRPVRRSPWYLKLSAYNAENDRRVEELSGWSKAAIEAQRTMLGRVDGVELEAYALDGTALTVFTPYPDAIADAAFVAISPNDPDLSRWLDDSDLERLLADISAQACHEDRSPAESPVSVETGLSVQIPEGANPLPVLICPYVDTRFGSTAILGIPDRDAGDRALAAKLRQATGLAWRLDRGRLKTRRAVRYRATDIPISQQQGWGTPIPIVHCDSCGAVPVPIEQLSALLPHEPLSSEATTTPRACPDPVGCTCPACGRGAHRETERLNRHMDLAWIELAPAVPPAGRARAMFDHPELSRWLPAGQVVQGTDNGGFLLTGRMVAKSLRDRGMLDFLPTGEPYDRALVHERVNAGEPETGDQRGVMVSIGELVDRFGADAVRFALLYAAAPSKRLTWNEPDLRHCHKFLNQLWEYAEPRVRASPDPSQGASIETSDRLRLRLAAWCETAITKISENFETLAMQRATRNVILMLTRIEDFERRAIAQRGELTEDDHEALSVALRLLVQLLAPLSPHIAEELWQRAGCTESLVSAPWPTPAALAMDARDGPAPARR